MEFERDTIINYDTVVEVTFVEKIDDFAQDNNFNNALQ